MADDGVNVEIDLEATGSAAQTLADIAAQATTAQAAVDALKAALANVSGPDIGGAMYGPSLGGPSPAYAPPETSGAATGYSAEQSQQAGGGMGGMAPGMDQFGAALSAATSSLFALASAAQQASMGGGGGGMGGGGGAIPWALDESGNSLDPNAKDDGSGGYGGGGRSMSLRSMMMPLRLTRMGFSMLDQGITGAANMINIAGNTTATDQMSEQQITQKFGYAIPLIGALGKAIDGLVSAVSGAPAAIAASARQWQEFDIGQEQQAEYRKMVGPHELQAAQQNAEASAQMNVGLDIPPPPGSQLPNYQFEYGQWVANLDQNVAAKGRQVAIAGNEAQSAEIARQQADLQSKMADTTGLDRLHELKNQFDAMKASQVGAIGIGGSLQAMMGGGAISDLNTAMAKNQQEQASLEKAMAEQTQANFGFTVQKYGLDVEGAKLRGADRQQQAKDEASLRTNELKDQIGQSMATELGFGSMQDAERDFAVTAAQHLQDIMQGGGDLSELSSEERQVIQQTGGGRTLQKAFRDSAEQDDRLSTLQDVYGEAGTVTDLQDQLSKVPVNLQITIDLDKEAVMREVSDATNGMVADIKKFVAPILGLKWFTFNTGLAKQQHGNQ